MITLQRVIQALTLLLFLVLLWLAAFPLPDWAPVDAFLRMDPLVFLGIVVSTRVWIAGLALAILILVLTAILGRFFCGFICPMGTTLDVTDRLLKRPRKSVSLQESLPDSIIHPCAQSPANQLWDAKWRKFKHLILLFILGGGALGISAVFTASPLSLITRFYALLLHPFVALTGDAFLHWVRPLALELEWDWAAYAQIPLPRFSTQWVVLFFFVMVMGLARYTPRFWCRYLCPSGAILAFSAQKPLVRRFVSADCTKCGLCQKACPMEAIPADPQRTNHAECIVCQTCTRICPTQAVSFQPGQPVAAAQPAFLPGRREALLAAVAGAGAATLTYTGLGEVRSELLPGNPGPETLIRPPGSLLERDFLSRCIRCGLCMRACPTNTLQPLLLQAGLIALFSPQLTPRRGPCEPECTVCGQVCPTGAIRALPLAEKTWAKVGTATILRHKCLAWEWDKKCLVCDEVCPYDAIELRRVSEHSIPVPFVQGHKCAGCGFCEYHCPVRASSAIVVEPMEALRMNKGSFREYGKSIGLALDVRKGEKPVEALEQQNLDQLPPGFSS
jgi:MauM/NapG family ferredoxin protein